MESYNRGLLYAVLFVEHDEFQGQCRWQVWSPIEGDISYCMTEDEAIAAAQRFSRNPALAAAVTHN